MSLRDGNGLEDRQQGCRRLIYKRRYCVHRYGYSNEMAQLVQLRRRKVLATRAWPGHEGCIERFVAEESGSVLCSDRREQVS